MMSLIELRNVSKYWGDVSAVEQLNINIEEENHLELKQCEGITNKGRRCKKKSRYLIDERYHFHRKI